MNANCIITFWTFNLFPSAFVEFFTTNVAFHRLLFALTWHFNNIKNKSFLSLYQIPSQFSLPEKKYFSFFFGSLCIHSTFSSIYKKKLGPYLFIQHFQLFTKKNQILISIHSTFSTIYKKKSGPYLFIQYFLVFTLFESKLFFPKKKINHFFLYCIN